VSCEREFSSLQREVFVPLQPGSAVFLFLFFSFSSDGKNEAGNLKTVTVTVNSPEN
jgi:hypothetical protein